jgi:nucleotide-binding universal stress UspA family protein
MTAPIFDLEVPMQMESTINTTADRVGKARNKGRETQGPVMQSRITSGLRDLMVHLDGTEADETRLQHAESIAAMSGAHLTGIYTNPLPDYGMVPGDAGGAAGIAMLDVEERIRREGDLTCERLRDRLSRLAVPNDLRRIEHTLGAIFGATAAEARWSDLFVATCPYREDGWANWDDVVEAVLFEGGHGVYLVPPSSKPWKKLNRVLVAWTDTREAARAVTQALPFLRATSDAEIVIVDAADKETATRGYAAADIAAHLDRHGVKVAIRPLEAGKQRVSEMLLDESRRRSADLIVMGAYGHSRWREWIIGGTTREMLASSEIPILMAH